LNADTVINNTYIVKSCNDKTITLENTSFERRNITNFYFDIVVEGGIKKYSDWSPKITFPDTGIYKGKLFLNPGTNCGDTLDLQMNIFLSLATDFKAVYDTCDGTPVILEDKSVTKNGKIVEWKWNIEGQDTLIKNLSYQFKTPGRKNIGLTVTDERQCVESIKKEILWYPTPRINIFPVNPIGCTPATFAIQNRTAPADSTYQFTWTYGDGSKSTAFNPIKTFEKEGTYNLAVDVVTPTGCKATKNYANYFTVKPGTDADFAFSPTRVTKLQNIVNFTDKSKNADSWNWFFNGKYFSNLANPTYTFRDTGLHDIKLVALNRFGCTDTLVKRIDVIPITTYFIPNAFTPNEDGLNDGFRGTGILDGMQDFSMRIFNRWGEMIFETKDPSEHWNGRKKNKGDAVPEGVYLCITTYKSSRGENNEVRGYVTLIR
jgi:gliding motility-associated-like protein